MISERRDIFVINIVYINMKRSNSESDSKSYRERGEL